MKIKEGPKERLIKGGVESLSDSELIAVILNTGTKKKNVMELSKDILDEIKSIKMLKDYNLNELMHFDGIGKSKAMMIISALELAKRIESINYHKKRIKTPKDLFLMFKDDLNDINERLGLVLLDSNLNVIYKDIISDGSYNYVYIDYKEIIKRALRVNAKYVGICHNHPSGNINPSDEDIDIMLFLEDRLHEFNIELFDSLIITYDKYFSMKYSSK